MQRYYGVDLADFWRGGLSIRRLDVLVRFMPVGSATWAVQNGVPFGWSLTDLLITDLYFALTGEQHPARPGGNGGAKSEAEAKAGMFDRLREQRERLSKHDR